MDTGYIYKLGTESKIDEKIQFDIGEWIACYLDLPLGVCYGEGGSCNSSEIEELIKLTVGFPDVRFIFIACYNDYKELEIYSLYQGDVILKEKMKQSVENDQYRIGHKFSIEMKHPL